MKKLIYSISSILLFYQSIALCETYIVAESGGDFNTIQSALNISVAGDTILVREKNVPYFEKISFPRSGDEANGYIILKNYPNENPIIDGNGVSFDDDWPQGLVRIVDKSYIKMIGFEIRNIIVSDDNLFPSGLWVYGSVNHVEILDNKFHSIQQTADNAGAHGIAVYGTHSSIPISNIVITGNEIYDCKLGWSESLVLNGNVENFFVSNNSVHDNDNIAYDFIGHEGICPNSVLDQARNGVVYNNVAYNIDSRGNQAYGNEASADGFYVDGGKDIIIERNEAYNCNIGIEIASEHKEKSTSGIIVRNNYIHDNTVIGITIGGYDENRGATNNCFIVNNTLLQNNSDNFNWGGEIILQYYCENNIFRNNIVVSGSTSSLINHSTNTGSNNTFNNNLYFSNGSSKWYWKSGSYSNLDSYKNSSGQDGYSIFFDPLFENTVTGNPALKANSPAVDRGDNLSSEIVGGEDYFGNDRIINNIIDIGCVEVDTDPLLIGEIPSFPNDFILFQNYPNPFNPYTHFRYYLSISAQVTLNIFDITGNIIRTIVDGFQSRGHYEIIWDAKNNTGESIAQGIYFASFFIDSKFIETIKLVLLQ